MRTILYYAALNPKGSSGQIVELMKEKLSFPFEMRNVVDGGDSAEAKEYDCLLFLIATYGDQELQEHIEKFLISLKGDFLGKYFAVCELGNYYGYDDYSFGSGQIIENHLIALNATRKVRLSSVDSLPKMDWWAVNHWISQLNANVLQ